MGPIGFSDLWLTNKVKVSENDIRYKPVMTLHFVREKKDFISGLKRRGL